MADVATALAEDQPLLLLSLASSLLSALEPRRPSPFEVTSEPDLPSRDELVRIFLDVDLLETSALLAVIAELSGDDITRRRIRREIAERAHALPGWLTDLHRTTVERVVEMVHVLGDGDNVMIGLRLPGGYPLSIVVYIDHNMGTLVKDAFVVAEPDEGAEQLGRLGQIGHVGNDLAGDPVDEQDLDRHRAPAHRVARPVVGAEPQHRFEQAAMVRVVQASRV